LQPVLVKRIEINRHFFRRVKPASRSLLLPEPLDFLNQSKLLSIVNKKQGPAGVALVLRGFSCQGVISISGQGNYGALWLLVFLHSCSYLLSKPNKLLIAEIDGINPVLIWRRLEAQFALLLPQFVEPDQTSGAVDRLLFTLVSYLLLLLW
jgi:hypothetical protein